MNKRICIVVVWLCAIQSLAMAQQAGNGYDDPRDEQQRWEEMIDDELIGKSKSYPKLDMNLQQQDTSWFKKVPQNANLRNPLSPVNPNGQTVQGEGSGLGWDWNPFGGGDASSRPLGQSLSQDSSDGGESNKSDPIVDASTNEKSPHDNDSISLAPPPAAAAIPVGAYPFLEMIVKDNDELKQRFAEAHLNLIQERIRYFQRLSEYHDRTNAEHFKWLTDAQLSAKRREVELARLEAMQSAVARQREIDDDAQIKALLRDVRMQQLNRESSRLKEWTLAMDQHRRMTMVVAIAVHAVLLVALAIALFEFYQAYQARRFARKETDQSLQLGWGSVEVRSSMYGAIVLGLALGFYMLYLYFAYTIHVVE